MRKRHDHVDDRPTGTGTSPRRFVTMGTIRHTGPATLLLACVLLTMGVLLLMPRLVTIPIAAEVYAFVFGGVEGMIYALGVMLVGERFKGAMLASATTMFTACWGAGTVLGPLLVGVGMDRFGAGTMALVICLFYILFLPLPVASFLRSRHQGSSEPS